METISAHASLVSAFDLHHKVNIRYPALEILNAFEEWKLTIAKDLIIRYEPSSLIKDPKVEAHTDRDTKEATRFVSYTKALAGHSEQYDEEETDAHDVKALVSDMGKLSSCAGTTELWASLCQLVIPRFEHRDHFHGVSFRRVSKLQCADGSAKEIHNCYVMSAKSFLRLRNSDAATETWYRDMRDLLLLLLSSDRAVRHLRFTIKQYRTEEEPDVDAVNFLAGWKAARAPSLVPSVCHKVAMEELEQEILKNKDGSGS